MPELRTRPLKHYPDNGKHLEVVTHSKFPYDITLGCDYMPHKDLWCVSPKVVNRGMGDFQNAEQWWPDLITSYHETAEEAFEEALTRAKDSAQKLLNLLNNL